MSSSSKTPWRYRRRDTRYGRSTVIDGPKSVCGHADRQWQVSPGQYHCEREAFPKGVSQQTAVAARAAPPRGLRQAPLTLCRQESLSNSTVCTHPPPRSVNGPIDCTTSASCS